MTRVGIGYDSHRFVGGRKLVLGGVTIPHVQGLSGHSDADALAHALIDAMLGAASMGDIGRMFPDSDPAFLNADSMLLLEDAYERIKQSGWVLNHTDITVIVEAPKLSPHIPAIQRRLSQVLDIEPAAISVKAKTNEGMGFIGRGEGIAVIAVATLARA